jgi:hypothetical protein
MENLFRELTYGLSFKEPGKVAPRLNHGHFGSKLHRSHDVGKTRAEITAPAFPPRTENDPEVKCPMRGIAIPWNVESIWSLETGGADQPGLFWCGTIPGTLFRSPDHGQSWELVRSLWGRHGWLVSSFQNRIITA